MRHVWPRLRWWVVCRLWPSDGRPVTVCRACATTTNRSYQQLGLIDKTWTLPVNDDLIKSAPTCRIILMTCSIYFLLHPFIPPLHVPIRTYLFELCDVLFKLVRLSNKKLYFKGKNKHKILFHNLLHDTLEKYSVQIYKVSHRIGAASSSLVEVYDYCKH